MQRQACILFLLAIAGCGGSSENHTQNQPPSPPPPPPQSGVQITVDELNRATAIIPPTGGTLAATGQDGTSYELIFPAGAVASESQISMVPISAITGTAYDDNLLAAVELSPDGLQFDVPAQLRVTPPVPLAADQLPLGVQMTNTGDDIDFWPSQADGNGYVVEISHFSVGGLGQMTEEQWYAWVREVILDKYYGPFGLVETLKATTSCSDYRFLIFENLVADIMRKVSFVGGEQAEFVLDPPRQCTGYVGDTPEYCANFFELDDAARWNIRMALEHFTRQATQQCSAGDAPKEAEAAQCLERAAIWSQLIPESEQLALCDIKAECGIATLTVEPPTLEVPVGETEQVNAIARDLLGAEIPGRSMLWKESAPDVAKLSDLAVANPMALGVSPGKTIPLVFDEMTGKTLCPAFYMSSVAIEVTNEFVTDATSVTVPEGQTSDLQVKLAYPPKAGVTASIAISGDPDITVASGSSLEFTPDNWDQFQTVLLFAYEDDDVVDGTAMLTITGTPDSSADSKVAAKEVLARELDNDAPSMIITPNPLCVETTRTANLSVIGNEFIDLNAIEWASSDTTVAEVNATGGVTARTEGPAQISATMIVDAQIVAVAYATLDVRQSCAAISTHALPAQTCVLAASNPAFKPVADTVALQANVLTPQQGHTSSWTTANTATLSVQPTGDDKAEATGKSGGTGTVELTVDNVVTTYHATLPVDVVSLPDGYHGAGLNLAYDPAIWAGLKDDRELVPSETLAAMLDNAVTSCGIGNQAMYDRMVVNNWHEFGKVIGEYQSETTSDIDGFVFDINECTLDVFRSPIRTPLGDDNFSQTSPLDINADGTIVGWTSWRAYGNWCDNNADYNCSYTVNTAFIYENGSFNFPFLNPNLMPYDPTAFNPQTGLSAINDNRQAIAWTTGRDTQGLYNLDVPVSETNPLLLTVPGDGALDNHGHVVGTWTSPWFYGGGTHANLTPQFDGATAPPYLYPVRINSFEDILAYGGDQISNPNWYLLYLCPLPVESPNADYLDNMAVLEGYEATESSCDGRDNDLDGVIDNGLEAPLATKQAGLCAGARKVCRGVDGWMDDYSSITGYEFPELSCDGKDNDCNGTPDDGCPPP